VFPAENEVPELAQPGEAPFHSVPLLGVLLPCDDETTDGGQTWTQLNFTISNCMVSSLPWQVLSGELSHVDADEGFSRHLV
jgi:hypothetical protein